MYFSADTPLKTLYETDALREIAPYLVYFGKPVFPPFFEGHTIGSKSKEDGWNLSSILNGLDFLLEMRKTGNAKCYPVYGYDLRQETMRNDVNLIRFTPKKISKDVPYVILCAGGGYQCVCSMQESIPTAAQLVSKGYQVFVLTYSVSQSQSYKEALQDLKSAVSFIDRHAQEFHLTPGHYLAGGFSAGANLVIRWSSLSEQEYAEAGVKKAAGLCLVYPPVVFTETGKEKETVKGMQPGTKYHCLSRPLDSSFPPSYIVCGKDDKVISCEHSEKLSEILRKLSVPHVLEMVPHGPHGFGDGSDTDAAGWPLRALYFLSQKTGLTLRG